MGVGSRASQCVCLLRYYCWRCADHRRQRDADVLAMRRARTRGVGGLGELVKILEGGCLRDLVRSQSDDEMAGIERSEYEQRRMERLVQRSLSKCRNSPSPNSRMGMLGENTGACIVSHP